MGNGNSGARSDGETDGAHPTTKPIGMNARIAVIGSGMTGLACATALLARGLRPLVLDKGRLAGGRVATRASRSGWQFDHGAQFVTARQAEFARLLAAMRADGRAAPWADGAAEQHWVGTPAMRSLIDYLAAGLDLRQAIEVTSIRAAGGTWQVTHAAGSERFDRVVVTVPAPQAADLLGPDDPLRETLAGVQLAPCLTLMTALDGDAPRPFVTQSSPDRALAWIARDSSKPGRSEAMGTAWVAHAGPEWSAEHLAADREAIAEHMLPLLLDRIGARPGQVRHAGAHRWRFARVTTALGQPFLRSPCATLYLGGDWCLGPRVEAAWRSGRAIAADIASREGFP